MEGSLIGKYKISRLIGEGGMASVYEAEHELLGTKVAIKVLNPILSANAQIRERFKNEAKVMASLNHPNITRVIDFDEQPQHLSIIMEYLEGEDLSQKIKKNGALSDKQINEVFTQTLSAFQYAHDKGIVHRDIKPSNIFILPDGQVKILDFGIAKLFGQGNEMTQTGTQMGTPTYMSPEQVKADKSIDNRSDIYSLGVTLYCIVNGKAPYNSATESQFDIFNKIVYEPLPEIIGNSKFNNIIIKACAKNREERFQNCNAWLSELNNPSTVHLSAPISEDKTVIANKVNNDATKVEQPIKNNANTSTQATNEQTIVDNIKQETENKVNQSSNTHSNLPQGKKSKTGLIIGIVAGVVLLIIIIVALNRPSEEKLVSLNDKEESLEEKNAFSIEDSIDMSKLTSLRQRILEGEDFEKIAREYSTDPSVKQTGGYYSAKRGQMVAPLEEMFYKTDSGTISPIFKTEYGYSILKALGNNENTGEYFFQWLLISHPKKM